MATRSRLASLWRIERKDGTVRIIGLWFERGFVPARAEGFVPAFRDALTAYTDFAGVPRLEWAPALARYSRLVGKRLATTSAGALRAAAK